MENKVLCAASSYEKKYYLNKEFDRLPESIKEELQIMCVLFTAEIGGMLTIEFLEDGTLVINAEKAEDDLLYDEISCGLKIKEMKTKKRELLEALEMYYKVFFLGLQFDIDEE